MNIQYTYFIDVTMKVSTNLTLIHVLLIPTLQLILLKIKFFFFFFLNEVDLMLLLIS